MQPDDKGSLRDMRPTHDTLRIYCLATAACHLVVGIIMAGIATANEFPGLHVQATKQLGWWFPADRLPSVNTTGLDTNLCPLAPSVAARDPTFRVYQLVLGGVGEIPVPWLVVAFHLISGVSQFGHGYSKQGYRNHLDALPPKTAIPHFFEYCISAPLMMVAMCGQFGITDVFTIVLIATNCAGCMMLGVLAEILYPLGERFIFLNIPRPVGAHWLAHFTGWALLTVSFVTMLSNLHTFKHCAVPGVQPFPDWVFALAYGELVAFSLFGFVQLGSFLWPNGAVEGSIRDQNIKHAKAVWTESAYITLSLAAKLGLGLTVFAGNYMVKR